MARSTLMHVSTHNRGKGHSAVAAAAYRLGVKLHDARTGLDHDYTNKGRDGVVAWSHVVPEGAAAELRDVEQCWNAAEAAEKRKDSQVCRDFRQAVPLGLTDEQAKAMMDEWAQYLSDRYNTVITVALHRDNERDVFGQEKTEAERGFHIHALVPTRAIGPDGSFGPKLDQLSNSRKSSIEIEECREKWAELCNDYAQRHDLNQTYDHRSHQRRGDGIEAEQTLGVAAAAMERRGVESDRGNEVREQRALRAELAQVRAQERQARAEAAAAIREAQARAKAIEQEQERRRQEQDRARIDRENMKAFREQAEVSSKALDRVKAEQTKAAADWKVRGPMLKESKTKAEREALTYGYAAERHRAAEAKAAGLVEQCRAAAAEAAAEAKAALPFFQRRRKQEALAAQDRNETRAEHYLGDQTKAAGLAATAEKNRDQQRAAAKASADAIEQHNRQQVENEKRWAQETEQAKNEFKTALEALSKDQQRQVWQEHYERQEQARMAREAAEQAQRDELMRQERERIEAEQERKRQQELQWELARKQEQERDYDYSYGLSR